MACYFKKTTDTHIKKWTLAFALLLVLASCKSVPEGRKDLAAPIVLPIMRVEPTECYFLDDFLPTPDNMVTGRSGGMYLRYYTYKSAVYKYWERESVMLSFFSRDNRCWSLFEEYKLGTGLF